MNKTANDIIDRVVEAKGIPDPGDTGLYWVNEIEHTIYNTLISLTPKKYLLDATVSILSGTDEYDLPANFDNIAVHGGGVFLFDSTSHALIEPLKETERGSTLRGYWINERTSKLVVTPMPSGDEDWTLVYIPTLTDITLGTQTLLLGSRFEALYVDWLFGYFLKDFQSASDQGAIQYTLSWAKVFEDKLKQELPVTVKPIRRRRWSRYDL